MFPTLAHLPRCSWFQRSVSMRQWARERFGIWTVSIRSVRVRPRGSRTSPRRCPRPTAVAAGTSSRMSHRACRSGRLAGGPAQSCLGRFNFRGFRARPELLCFADSGCSEGRFQRAHVRPHGSKVRLSIYSSRSAHLRRTPGATGNRISAASSFRCADVRTGIRVRRFGIALFHCVSLSISHKSNSHSCCPAIR